MSESVMARTWRGWEPAVIAAQEVRKATGRIRYTVRTADGREHYLSESQIRATGSE